MHGASACCRTCERMKKRLTRLAGRTKIRKSPGPIKSTLIASCGMNCRLCIAFIREKNTCPGCLVKGVDKTTYSSRCRIKNCKHLAKSRSKYCFKCEKYPCARMKQIDKRYSTKYGMSMLENLDIIEKSGIRYFIKQEKKKRACSQCGEILCVHDASCMHCGTAWR